MNLELFLKKHGIKLSEKENILNEIDEKYTEMSAYEARCAVEAIYDALEKYDYFSEYFEIYDKEYMKNSINIIFKVKSEKINEFVNKKLYDYIDNNEYETKEEAVSFGKIDITIYKKDYLRVICIVSNVFKINEDILEKNIDENLSNYQV